MEHAYIFKKKMKGPFKIAYSCPFKSPQLDLSCPKLQFNELLVFLSYLNIHPP